MKRDMEWHLDQVVVPTRIRDDGLRLGPTNVGVIGILKALPEPATPAHTQVASRLNESRMDGKYPSLGATQSGQSGAESHVLQSPYSSPRSALGRQGQRRRPTSEA